MTLTIKSAVKLTSGYSMPLLGFGVYQNYNAKPSVLEAFQVGYRHIDSAQAYKNEGAVGEAVRDSGIPREELFITTKCASKTHGYDSTLKGVEESLARFGFDYIDLFLIHDPFSGAQQALLDAQKAGKIRTVGVSNYGIKHLDEIKTAGLPMPAINQIELHPLCQQRPIVEYCRAHAIVVQAYCPIIRGQMGHLAIQAVSNKYGRDPAQILIRWSLQNGFVPLPKSSTPNRIRSNAAVYDFELAPGDMEDLNALDLGKAGAVSWNPVDAA
ncbi:Aldo/keto reductase [Pisolithus albus]|nr:Aldo/keto reductase [Pisolithus albus]